MYPVFKKMVVYQTSPHVSVLCVLEVIVTSRRNLHNERLNISCHSRTSKQPCTQCMYNYYHVVYRLLDSLVVECWLRVREVPGSNVLVLTIFNEGVYLTFKSIFH